jgi:hypothetical protein
VVGGLIPVSTASRLLVLPENEQVKISTADNPGQAARQAVRQLGRKRRGIDLTRLCEELTSIFERTLAVEMQDMVRLFLDQRATSYEQCERLAESTRACAARVADLASRIEEPNLCAYQYCGRVYGRRSNTHAPGAKYCSSVCARAGRRALGLQRAILVWSSSHDDRSDEPLSVPVLPRWAIPALATP